MLSVGVDIAKDAANTAVCTVRWEASAVIVEDIVVGANDEAVLTAAASPGVAAIALDAPFGWPVAMVAAVSAWYPGGKWAAPKDVDFRLRRTDRVTTEKTKVTVLERRSVGESGLRSTVPLSVAADRIAMAAWRCCALLDALSNSGAEIVTQGLGTVLPIDGRRRVIEAYPAAALAMWGIPREGYKSKDAASLGVRGTILAAIERASAKEWIQWAPGVRERCTATDHALDAFICALVARAAVLGLVDAAAPADIACAGAEGWIALPHRDGLRLLSALAAP